MLIKSAHDDFPRLNCVLQHEYHAVCSQAGSFEFGTCAVMCPVVILSPSLPPTIQKPVVLSKHFCKSAVRPWHKYII